MHTAATAAALTAAINSAIAAVPAGGTAEEAYKAFMDKLGEGFTQALGDALGAAAGVVGTGVGAAGASPHLAPIFDLLKRGAGVQLSFSCPGLMVPMTQKVAARQGAIVGPAPAATAMGGSVGVTGSYSF